MLNWVIAGGGVHGVIIALALTLRGGADRASMRIVDPGLRLLDEWRRRARSSGMEYLRSPAAHGLEPDFASLTRWARQTGRNGRNAFRDPNRRPSLELWNAYAADTVARHRLEQVHRQDRVVRVTRAPDAPGTWRVHLADGSSLSTRRVVFSLGPPLPAAAPVWAASLGERCEHIYARSFVRDRALGARRPVIIGGGVAGVGLALWLVGNRRAQTDGPVVLVARKRLIAAQYDSDPCFAGPRCMEPFLMLPTPAERRSALGSARYPGSVPPGTLETLSGHVAAGRIACLFDEVTTAAADGDHIEMTTHAGRRIAGDYVALATGFAGADPTTEILRAMRAEAETEGRSLAVDEAGNPLLRDDLSWTDGLYLTGRRAELELGPNAANIIGAHNASKRIVSSLSGRVRPVPVGWSRYAS